MRKRNTNPQKDRDKRIRNQVAKAVHAIRQGIPAYRAARENGVSLRTIKQRAGKNLVQERLGARIRAKKNDRLLRYLEIPGPDGPIEITVRGLKAAREVAKYKAAVNRFLAGDRNALADWHGKKVAGIELITAGDVLIDQEDKGLLPYALYRSFAGSAA
jgi:hypothetical protein